MKKEINIRNKKASFNYEFIDKYTAGIVLTGTEIKAIRESKVSFTDSYCRFINKELWLIGIHISEYSYGSYNNHTPKRDRKLLLNKKELQKINKKIDEKGLTIVPVRLFINNRGYAKIVIAVSRGKAKFDKRHDIKDRDNKRELDRYMKK